MDHSATKTSLLLFISISSLLLLLANAVPSTRNIHIVRRDLRSDLSEFCKKTTNPNLCAQTIQPHFLHGALEPLKALDAEVDATLDKVKKTLAHIQTLLAKQGASKSMKDSLDICKDQYGSMLDAIKETKTALGENDVITAKFKFSAVISYQGSCKDAFEGEAMPFTEDSDSVFQLGGNCLDIIADMEEAAGPQRMPPPVQQPPSAFSNVIGILS
ncbi:Pectinesterase inhibitor [Spatholobus suberectus]|nr:Pectinesterase inhibitor [Spatholobus suberectus]